MGIRGLTTYINKQRNLLRNYELHDEYLVIDGHSLAAQLYTSSGPHCAFGGDHNKFASVVKEFFDDLRKCEVIPLVIMDGGMLSKKMKTMFTRMKQKLHLGSHFTPANHGSMCLIPMINTIIFERVLKEMGIKIVRSVFEADPCIAGIAKLLDCPVLSLDSDFYIFGVKYIPINTLLPFVTKKSCGKRYAKDCKIFKVEYLLESVPGLRSSVLPLIPAILGNDYINIQRFQHFFNCLKLKKQNDRLYCTEQRKIDIVFTWLKNYNLEDAVAAVLSKLPKKSREKVLNDMEMVINGYLELPIDLSEHLGLSKIYQKKINVTKQEQQRFKFQKNVNTLKSTQLWKTESTETIEDSSSNDEIQEEKEESRDIPDIFNVNQYSEDDFCLTWPTWFANQFYQTEFPTYFVNMMYHRLFTVPIQMEDYNYPSAYIPSLKIVGIIDGLLVSGREESETGLLLVIREGRRFIRQRIDTIRRTDSAIFPSLEKLSDLPIKIKKQIFNDALEISNEGNLIKDIPDQWQLYIASAIYWMRQRIEPIPNSCHLYSLLFNMLMSVIDRNIGYHKRFYAINKEYRSIMKDVINERKHKTSDTANKEENSLIEAFEAVTKNDCLLAAPFFNSNFKSDPLLSACPRKFNAKIVHCFSQFQSCIRHAYHLNILLGYPYESPIIAEMFNGTLLYNLYTNFEKRNDIENYIGVILENSPSLLHLLKLLIQKVLSILGETPLDGTRSKGVRKRRSKKKSRKNFEEKEYISSEDQDERKELFNSIFVDPQNSFSALGLDV